MQEQTFEHAPTSRKPKKIFLVILTSLLIVAAIAGLVLQQLMIQDLSRQVGKLQQTQLPQKQFASYQDCVDNGGKDLWTINGQFSACLGGKFDGESDQYQAYLQYSAQNLPRIDEHKISKVDNRVDNADKASADLVAFLKEDYTGCEIGSADGKSQGYYNVMKEVPNRFALMSYGCAETGQPLPDGSFIIAMKLGTGWSLLSPTNNMNEDGVPSCLMVDMFKISKDLTAQCFENTGYGEGNLRDNKYL